MNDRVRRLQIELAGIGVLKATDVAGKLHNRHLHAETNAEERNPILASVTDGRDLSFAAAIAETAGNKDSVGLSKQSVSPFLLDLLGLDAIKLDANFIGVSAVNQGLEQALVGLFAAH